MDTKDLCLGVLSLGEASGYDIRKRLEETFSHFMEISPSGVYPALKQLAFQGLVTATRVEQEDRPNKRVYKLTEAGRTALDKALTSSEGRHKVRSELLVLMYFAERLPAGQLERLLAARASELEGFTAATEAWCNGPARAEGTPGQRLIADYALAVMRAETAFLRAKLGTLSTEVAGVQRNRAPVEMES